VSDTETLGKSLKEVKKQAMSYLARREHSEFELCHKLEKKGYEFALIEQCIAFLYEADYLNEGRYVEAMIRHHYGRGQGPKKITYALRQNQVASTLIQQAFNAFDGDWYELAAQVRERKFGDLDTNLDKNALFKEKSRQMRFLASRGFDSSHIEAAF